MLTWAWWGPVCLETFEFMVCLEHFQGSGFLMQITCWPSLGRMWGWCVCGPVRLDFLKLLYILEIFIQH